MELLHFCSFLFILGQAASSHHKLNRQNCGKARPIGSTRIVGGQVAKVGAWPWMVVTYLRGRPWCGGSLITNNYVITAAHCMYRDGKTLHPSNFVVRIGAHDLQAGGSTATHENIAVEAVVNHSKFDPDTFDNDICLLKLKKSVQFRKLVQPICLPDGDLRTKPLAGRRAFVAGWGRTQQDGKGSPLLLQVQVPIWEQSRCVEAYKKRNITITGVSFCAGYKEGKKDACMGDSGGPLMLPDRGGRFYIMGIVSNGIGCALANFPGVYTNVREFIPWITENMI